LQLSHGLAILLLALRGEAACGGGSFEGRTARGHSAPDLGDVQERTLNAQVAPGGNFDLSLWELQEPVGTPGSPTVVSPGALEGPNGFQDMYFHTDPTDGAMMFWDPENGVATPHSQYPRSELSERSASGRSADWPIVGINRLSAIVEIVEVPDRVCFGQIHVGAPIRPGLTVSTKPLLELYCTASGAIVLGIEDSPEGHQTLYDITRVPLLKKFSYTIQLTGTRTIALTVDGATSTYEVPASFSGYGMYFKAGDYDQTAGPDGSVGATVKFYALQVSHR
jgi:Alginate lyase